MATNSFTSNFKKHCPYALIMSVLIVFMGQAILVQSITFWKYGFLCSYPMAHDYFRFDAQIHIIPNDEANKKVLFIGSSQMREAVDVELLNTLFSEKKYRFYNLGVSGGAQPIQMFLLKEKIAQLNPDLIVYMPFLGSFYDEYNISMMRFTYNKNIIPYLRDKFGSEYFWENKDAFLDSYLSTASVFYKHREAFQTLILDFLLGYKSKQPRYFAYDKNNESPYYQEQIEKHRINRRYNHNKYTDLNKEIFEKFIFYMSRNELNCIIIDGATHPFFEQTFDPKLTYEYYAFIKAVSKKYHIPFVQKQSLSFLKQKDFLDFTHLNSGGRQKFTLFLKELVENTEYRMDTGCTGAEKSY